MKWVVTDTKYLTKPSKDWQPHIPTANTDTAYIEVRLAAALQLLFFWLFFLLLLTLFDLFFQCLSCHSTKPVRRGQWWAWQCRRSPCWPIVRLWRRPATTVKVRALPCKPFKPPSTPFSSLCCFVMSFFCPATFRRDTSQRAGLQEGHGPMARRPGRKINYTLKYTILYYCISTSVFLCAQHLQYI